MQKIHTAPYRYKTGLLVGRFQPFHKGHLYIIRQALESCEKFIIAIGSANVLDQNNPLSYQTRQKILQKVVLAEGLEKRISNIVPSNDFAGDEQWLAELLKKTGEFEVVIGNNEWTNGVLAAAGYVVQEIPFLDRERYQGTYIRQLIRTNQAWEDRVPAYILADVKKAFQKSERGQ